MPMLRVWGLKHPGGNDFESRTSTTFRGNFLDESKFKAPVVTENTGRAASNSNIAVRIDQEGAFKHYASSLLRAFASDIEQSKSP